MAGLRVAFEPLHHRSRSFLLRSTAAVDQPVDFHHGKSLEAAQEVGYCLVLDGHYELVKVYEGEPPCVKPVLVEAGVVGGELHVVAGEVVVFHQSLLDVWRKHFLRTVGAFVVVDVEFVHPLAPVPFYPFLEIRSFVLRYGADGQVMRGLRVVAVQPVHQFQRVERSVAQYSAPAVSRHFEGNNPGYYLGIDLFHRVRL